MLDLLAARLVKVTLPKHLIGRHAVIPVGDVFAYTRREWIGGGHESVRLDVEVVDARELVDVPGKHSRVAAPDGGPGDQHVARTDPVATVE